MINTYSICFLSLNYRFVFAQNKNFEKKSKDEKMAKVMSIVFKPFKIFGSIERVNAKRKKWALYKY